MLPQLELSPAISLTGGKWRTLAASRSSASAGVFLSDTDADILPQKQKATHCER
jgi:hypothetical protein